MFLGKAYGPTKDSLELELRDKLDKKFDVYKTRNSELCGMKFWFFNFKILNFVDDRRDRAFLGFGSLQTAVVAAVVVMFFSKIIIIIYCLWFNLYFKLIFNHINNKNTTGICVCFSCWIEYYFVICWYIEIFS